MKRPCISQKFGVMWLLAILGLCSLAGALIAGIDSPLESYEPMSVRTKTATLNLGINDLPVEKAEQKQTAQSATAQSETAQSATVQSATAQSIYPNVTTAPPAFSNTVSGALAKLSYHKISLYSSFYADEYARTITEPANQKYLEDTCLMFASHNRSKSLTVKAVRDTLLETGFTTHPGRADAISKGLVDTISMPNRCQ